MPPKKKSPAATPSPVIPQPPHEVIALRAYEFFVERGYAHGGDLQDWFQAESELTAQQLTPPVQSAKTVRRRKPEASKAAAS
jgi:hypothetical protein